MIKKVTVFGARNNAGQAEIRELLKQGYIPSAVTRDSDFFVHDDYLGTEITAADYDDPGSLEAAVRDADAVFFQPPSMALTCHPGRVWSQCVNVSNAVKQAGLKRFVLNSMMWAPDGPDCGQSLYDNVRRIEDLFADCGIPLVIFRPVLLMSNLLAFAEPLSKRGIYRYCQRPGMLANWMCTEDLALFMVEALNRDELISERIAVGGPETLPIEKVLSILSEIIGRPIRHDYVEARKFGEESYETFGTEFDLNREAYCEFFDSFYSFNNFSASRPFEVDMDLLLQRVPLKLTSFKEWAARQNWQASQKLTL